MLAGKLNQGTNLMAAKPKPDDKEQSRLFIETARETAREIGADEEASAADEVL